VHQEADRAAVHAVDRLAGFHEVVQGLQHQPVAAERDDGVRLRRFRVAVHRRQPRVGVARLRRLAGDEGDVVKSAHEDPETMERAVLVYTTWPSLVEAERSGRVLVERRLAACVNILPGMISHYWWQGKLERGEETVALFKTRASLAEPLRQAVKEAHPYETPSIMVMPIESIDADYYAWILKETER